MSIQDLKDKNLILFECISGSKSYGLDLPHSDTDIKGVYYLPKEDFYSMDYIAQVNNDTNDEVYYELGRFIELLLKNNPNILELLYTSEDCILKSSTIIDKVKSFPFLSKLCKDTFAGYALNQIKKAKGLNKKIVNPMDEVRKTVLDFCYVVHGQGSISLTEWLIQNGFAQEDCGLVNITHMRDTYAIYHISQLENEIQFSGIISNRETNEVSLSSVPKDIMPLATMNFNKDGYSKYCKDYLEYWNWVKVRNEERYKANLNNEKNYDAKNMMHVFRLLRMSEEIAVEQTINVKRKDRDFLLRIRAAEFTYDDLVKEATEKIEQINYLFDVSTLPDKPDVQLANQLLIDCRKELYG